jgi:DNA-binding MarR family transcriptional regulator
MTERLPLPIIVSRSIGAISRAYAAAAPVDAPSLPFRAALLRFSSDPPSTTRELPARSRLSSRTTKVAVGAAERHGWVVTEPDADRPRHTALRFTETGVEASRTADDSLAAVEDPWLVDAGDAERLRRAAEALVGRLDLELPHHPISYGGADVTVTGGAYAGARTGPDPRIPAHGTDWRAVLRTDPSSAVGLRISALLSQVLVQFTIDYQGGGGFNLASATRVLRHKGDDGVPLASLDGEGITGDGRSLLERHGVVRVDRARGDGAGRGERVVRLTPSGLRLRDTYTPLVGRVEADWRARYGDELLDTLTDELLERRGSWLPLDDRGATPDDHAVVGLTAKRATVAGPGR